MKISIWDILAYIALGIIIAYFLLKTLNIIHSPLEFDIIVIVSGAYLITRYTMKIDFISSTIKQHSKELKQIKKNCIHGK